ncbi:hypothetical protein F2S72_08925 [Pseudomonas syringae pv. actinidiae]|nr:hypothetical protein [Pseudomonas syringae pv. actinidiae]
MDVAANLKDLPAAKLNPSSQLATLLAIRASIGNGDTAPKVVAKFREFTPYFTEQEGWDKVVIALKNDASFPLALAQSGLFENELERIFTVTDETQKAVDAAIEFLSITLKQP